MYRRVPKGEPLAAQLSHKRLEMFAHSSRWPDSPRSNALLMERLQRKQQGNAWLLERMFWLLAVFCGRVTILLVQLLNLNCLRKLNGACRSNLLSHPLSIHPTLNVSVSLVLQMFSQTLGYLRTPLR